MTKLNKRNVKKAIPGSAGILAHIAKRLNVSRATICLFVKKHADIRELLQEESERINDIAEAKLIQKIEEGDNHMIKFRLMTKAKDRGYFERQEVEHSGQTTFLGGGILKIEVVKNKKEEITVNDDRNENKINNSV
jgi:AcrR family transcriptional regulator